MTGMKRRHFLHSTLTLPAIAQALSAMSLPAQATVQLARPQWRADPFALGVASGEPRPDSVLLWTRLYPGPAVPGQSASERQQQAFFEAQSGMRSDQFCAVSYEIFSDEALTKRVQRGEFITHARRGWSVHVRAQGLRPDRLPVLPGGFAIMWAVFQELGLERMTFSEGALRLGVLYDLLGRYHHHDLRDATVSAFGERYGVDLAHAREVAATARAFLLQIDPAAADNESIDRRFLEWAALLHEAGVSVAHSSYHKHSAYILGNADMPGFSRMDQGRLARIVLAHRGKLARVVGIDPESADWRLILCLRLAVVVHRARDGRGVPPLRLKREGRGYVAVADSEWLRNLPLTASALEEEERQWQAIGLPLKVRVERAPARNLAGA